MSIPYQACTQVSFNRMNQECIVNTWSCCLDRTCMDKYDGKKERHEENSMGRNVTVLNCASTGFEKHVEISH